MTGMFLEKGVFIEQSDSLRGQKKGRQLPPRDAHAMPFAVLYL